MSGVQKTGRDVRVVAKVEKGEVVSGSASTKLVGAMKSRVSSAGTHVEYTIRVVYERGTPWYLKKRYSEVAALHDVLKLRLPRLPDLPSKTAMRQFSPEHIEARKEALAKYLAELCLQRDAMNAREVHEFLGLCENLPAFQEPHASEPVKAAEVQEVAFGITDFSYDIDQGLLLLGAVDPSWISRMDAKLTSIKLPWERKPPTVPTAQMSLWKQRPGDIQFEFHFGCKYSPQITCVEFCSSRQEGVCLCGLSDGTIGCHPIKSEPGVTHAGGVLPLARQSSMVVALAFDEQSDSIISVSRDTVLVYDAQRSALHCEVTTPGPVTKVVYVKETKRLFCGKMTGGVVVWDTSNFPIRNVATIPDGAEAAPSPAAKICALNFDCASNTLFTASKEGFKLWAVKSSDTSSWGRCVGQLSVYNALPTAVTWSNSLREMIAGFTTGAIVIFDTDSGESTYAFQAHSDEITKILWLDGSRRLLTACRDKTVRIWDFGGLSKTSSEDEVGLAPQAPPTGSVPSRVMGASTDGRGYPVPTTSSVGGDPLLGRGPLGGSALFSSDIKSDPSPASRVSSDPLSRILSSSSQKAKESETASFTTPPAADTSPVTPSRHESISRDSANPPPVFSKSRHIAGSKPGTYAGGDSDSDELVGWDK